MEMPDPKNFSSTVWQWVYKAVGVV